MKIEFPPKLKCLFEPSRYKILYGGRGGTKSWGVARALIVKAANKPIRVLCAREFQSSIRDSVHKLLSDQITLMGYEASFDVELASIKSTAGAEFSFEGLHHNVSKIKSYEGIDIVWVEEAHAVSKLSWDTLIPTIRKDGSEIWMTFNPEFEDDETFDRFVLNPPPNATVVKIDWRDNPWFPKVLDDERRALKARDPAAYDHVWEGQCRRWLEGAIYAEELREAFASGRVRRVPHDPAIPVYTAWDLGRTDDTAIWWYQCAGREVHILESYARSGGDPSDFAAQVLGREVQIDIVQGKVKCEIGSKLEGLEHRHRYRYATHWLPHDAKAKTLAAHGKSTQEQLSAALGFKHIRITPNLDREDGIKTARAVFGNCFFDADGCVEGLKALRRYKRETLPDGVSLQRAPKHDWSSHYADAFRYLSVAVQAPPPAPSADEGELDAWGRPVTATRSWRAA